MKEIPLSKLRELPEVKQLGKLLGIDNALAYLGLTAIVESDVRNVLRLDKSGFPADASGVFQFIPSTIRLFAKAYNLTWSNTDVLTQARFAAAHAIEDARWALANSRLGDHVAPGYKALIPASGMARTMAIMRLHYNLGPQKSRWSSTYKEYPAALAALTRFVNLMAKTGKSSSASSLIVTDEKVSMLAGVTEKGKKIWVETDISKIS